MKQETRLFLNKIPCMKGRRKVYGAKRDEKEGEEMKDRHTILPVEEMEARFHSPYQQGQHSTTFNNINTYSIAHHNHTSNWKGREGSLFSIW